MKNSPESIRSKLKNLSKTENIDFQIILIRYFHERFLFRLSKSNHKNHFLLKGGTLLYALEGIKTRPTLDIDFLGVAIANDIGVMKNIFTEICRIQYEEDCVWFDANSITAENITENDKYNGVRLHIDAKLVNIRQRLQIDIGFGDVYINDPQQLQYPVLLNESEVPLINAYSIETIIAEKFQAMIELSTLNSRMKDFYDVYKLLINNMYNVENLTNAIKLTFKNRMTFFTEDHALFSDEFISNLNRQKLWNNFLKKKNIKEKIAFQEIMQVLKEKLYPIWLNI
jgi:predicted nucleotidyltransferase component of viral defense system